MRRLLNVLLAGALAACPASEELPEVKPVVLPPDPGPPPVLNHWEPVAADGGAANAGPLALGRRTRRLSVEQLRNSLPAVFNDTWRFPITELDGGVIGLPDGGELSFYPIDLIAPVLGEADYLTEFQESLDVTPSFLKFLDNAAANVCVRTVLKDIDEPAASKRVFVRHLVSKADAGTAERDQALQETLRFVRLKFHAVYVAPTDTTAIADLEQVYRTMHAKRPIPGDDRLADAVAWIAVCIHTVTDPAFVLY